MKQKLTNKNPRTRRLRIMIPTAGNRSVLISAFREQDLVERVITTEIDELAPGGYFADKCYKVPRSKAPGFLKVLEQICKKEKIDLLVPLADLDLIRFAKVQDRFNTIGVEVWAAPQRTLKLSIDKWQTYKLLRRLKIPTPETQLLSDADVSKLRSGYPCYLKPRFVAMKNSPDYFFKLIENSQELKYYINNLKGKEKQYLIQESLLNGKEINVDFFVQNRELKRLVTLYRLKAGEGGGIIRGETIPCDPIIKKMAENLITDVDFKGAANFQVYDMGKDRYLLTEINPRFSNSSAICVRPAGVDFFDLTLKMFNGENIKPKFNNYRMLKVTTSYQLIVVKKSCFEK